MHHDNYQYSIESALAFGKIPHVPEISDFLFERLKNANRKISFVSYFIFDDASKGKMLHKTFCSLVCFVQNSYSG